MTHKDVILYFGFPFVIVVVGVMLKFIMNKITRLLDDKETSRTNELLKLATKMEEIYKSVMDMKADLPSSFTTKEEYNRHVGQETAAHTRIHERIDDLYGPKKNTPN